MTTTDKRWFPLNNQASEIGDAFDHASLLLTETLRERADRLVANANQFPDP